MSASSASLIEIFSAIQGEGLNVGTRQIFIRFGGCDLRCTYCDSDHTWQKQKTCLVEKTPGLRDFYTYANPIEINQLLDWVADQDQLTLHDSISFTGGEPLLQAKFLAEFLPRLRQQTTIPFYLESGGHRPQQLAMIAPHLNLVGMDIKLPSTSGEEHWSAHQEFLTVCLDHQLPVFVKAIVDRNTDKADLEKAAQIIANIDSSISLFLQPVSPLTNPHHHSPIPPHPDQILQWQKILKQILESVRVIPQTHKAINQR